MVGAAGSAVLMSCIEVCRSGVAEAISAHRLISAIRKPRGTHAVLAGNAVEVSAWRAVATVTPAFTAAARSAAATGAA